MAAKLPLLVFGCAIAVLALAHLAEAGLTPPSSDEMSDADQFYDPKESDLMAQRRRSRLMTGQDKENSQVTKKELNDVPCSEMNRSCQGCVRLTHCIFAMFNNSESKCTEHDTALATIQTLVPGFAFEGMLTDEKMCPEADTESSTVKPKFDQDTNTTTTTSTTSTTPTTTSADQNTTTTAQNSTTSTTTPTTTTSLNATTVTTTATSTSTTSSTSRSPTPSTSTAPIDPDAKGGNSFDGWSFFGGILLTVGISTIGFVSYKYYKVRSTGQGTGANYNRF
jgi:hypothetical protein